MPKTSDKAWHQARRKALRQLATTTDAEDAEIRAGIAQDPDAFQLTDEMWARMRPATEVVPEIVEGPALSGTPLPTERPYTLGAAQGAKPAAPSAAPPDRSRAHHHETLPSAAATAS